MTSRRGPASEFSTGWTSAYFINSIELLKNTFKADVIVDDIGFDLQALL